MTLAILCPGQGAQHPQMLDLVCENRAAASVLAQGEEALGTHVRAWLAQPDQLVINTIAQPLLCLTQLATWAALREADPAPRAFAGYSVGELASYGCAGALRAFELVRIAQTRAALMDAASATPSGLVAVRGLPRAEVQALCTASTTWIAIANGEDAFVVGGESQPLRALAHAASSRGGQINFLRVGIASHTPLLASAVRPFCMALDASALVGPSVPVIAGVDASLVTSRVQAIATLGAQLAAPIEWARCLDVLFELGCRVFLELGPGSALSNMARERLGDDIEARSVSDFRSLLGVERWLKSRQQAR